MVDFREESKVNYGQELGPNLIKVAKKLLKNQDLLKLLINTDLDPLNKEKHPDIIDGSTILHKNIRVIPLLQAEEVTTESTIVLLFRSGTPNSTNAENENLSLLVSVYCPFKEWAITGDTMRPFAIMSEVRKSLQNKRINGLGEIRYEGFNVSNLSTEMGCYMMEFYINAFN
jgi:hypothetical protein